MDFKLPELGEGVYEAELVRWLVKPGDAVKRAQILMEVLTDKATMEVPAPFAGTVQSLNVEPGQQIRVGDAVLSYGEAAQAAEKPAPKKEKAAPAAKVSTATAPVAVAATTNGPSTPQHVRTEHVKAAPSVRYLARKLGIDLARVHGSGPEGRILMDDLAPLLSQGEANRPAREAPTMDLGKPGTRVKLHGLRRKIADAMVHAKQTIPHYTYVDECDVTDLARLRETLKEPYAKKGIKLTYLAFFVKAVVGALQEVPIVNASLDDEKEEIVLHDRYHVGIAVATPAGLIVPVIHDADKLDLVHIAQEVERLSQDARAGKNKLDDLRGGTFTITSIGNLGGLFATPIIPHPQVGILGVGKIVKRPIYDEHMRVKPADMVYLSFSFDHRVLDGAVGTMFGNAVMGRLRDPGTLLVEH